MNNENIRPISQVLLDLKDELPAEKICTFDLIQKLHERGIGLLLFLFALPAAIPLPGFGINFIIAIPLLLLTAQQAIGRRSVWIPEKMKYKSISREKYDSIIDGAMPWITKIELLSRPRLGFVTQGIFSNFIGVCGLIMALSVCVPLPLTNTVPSMGIALMAVGVIMRDGLAVLAGMVLGLAWVAMLIFAVTFLGLEGIDFIKETIKSYL